MDLGPHGITSTIYAGGVYSITGSFELALAGFLSGTIIDVDHIIEYWNDKGFDLNVTCFFAYCKSGKNSYFFIILHSFELIAIIFLISAIMNSLYVGIVIAGGILLHLFLDYFNIIATLSYKYCSIIIFSFIYRMSKNFKREIIDAEIRKRS